MEPKTGSLAQPPNKSHPQRCDGPGTAARKRVVDWPSPGSGAKSGNLVSLPQ
ncbi:hypothetical protein ACKVWC_008533 [Pyricularia oryzae]|nr:hypothetical protein MCOR01_008044 [Pyricularia oryzae]